jgi:colicin import membrane protein
LINDNRVMRSSVSFHGRAGLAGAAALLIFACATVAAGADATGPGEGDLRERFPPSSIDSVPKADAALAATAGAKVRAEKEYKSAARECLKKFLVNDCVDEARARHRQRLSEIEAIQVEANRFKRRDKADRIESERAQREAERAANAKAEADLRAKNRQSYDDKQEQARREAADRARSDAARAGRPATHSPLITGPKPGSPEANAAQRAKNAADQATKVKEANAHREQLVRRHAEKEAERVRRAKEKADKEAAQKAAPATAPAKP